MRRLFCLTVQNSVPALFFANRGPDVGCNTGASIPNNRRIHRNSAALAHRVQGSSASVSENLWINSNMLTTELLKLLPKYTTG